MRGLDARLHRAPASAIDLDQYFDKTLPMLLAERHSIYAQAAQIFDLPDLSIAAGSRRWHLHYGGSHVAVSNEGSADLELRTSPRRLEELVTEMRSPKALHILGEIQIDGGSIEDLDDWWIVLRSAIDGRVAHFPGAISLTDAAGGSIDLGQSFTWADSVDELNHFLAETGFLCLRGVFGSDEMAMASAEMDKLFASATKEDGSWWARTREGEHLPVRIFNVEHSSPILASLVADQRVSQVPTLAEEAYVRSEEGVEALQKPSGVVEGVSDIDWHRDCALGEHTYRCPVITVGICVTAADSLSGQLGVVAGSHRALAKSDGLRFPGDLPEVGLDVEPGDMTIHLSCTLHRGYPVVTAPRRTIYLGFVLADSAGDSDLVNRDAIYRRAQLSP